MHRADLDRPKERVHDFRAIEQDKEDAIAGPHLNPS
jgi:hypothetical protein